MASSLEDAVQRVLPSLTGALLGSVIDKLLEDGVEDVPDLKFVQEKDLVGILKPIQVRKLLTAWNDDGK